MKTRVEGCQNFECSSNNKKGECCLEGVHLVPCGPHIDRLRCVEATEPDKSEVIMKDGVATRGDDTDPSSR